MRSGYYKSDSCTCDYGCTLKNHKETELMVRKTRYYIEYSTITDGNIIRNSQDIEKIIF